VQRLDEVVGAQIVGIEAAFRNDEEAYSQDLR
jgi:hypothetical protein